MKNLLWSILAVFFAFSSASSKTVDRIVAQVNEEIVTLSELNQETAQIRQELATKYSGEELEQMVQKAEQEALESLIREKLLYQKGLELGFNADVDKKIAAAVQQVVKENNFEDTEELEKALEQAGRSLREFREQFKKQIIINDLIYEFVDSRIALLTPEIEKYYKDHQEDFSTPDEVTLSTIVIKEATDRESEERANDIYGRLQKGESFAALASQYSKGATANTGGNIGTYILSKLNALTLKAIEGLKEGDSSKPQKEPEGFVLYRIDSRKVAAVRPLDQVKNEIKNRIYAGKRGPELERYINQLKEDAYIQIFSEAK
ncbi:MAG: peptidyl-prolyl cis-trans isomerase [Acidobacteria bacterium]|nr:peptidyl-prolyl cis-trans isomerase [Acidobacteriota bacterium]